jgi:hypothetical protein
MLWCLVGYVGGGFGSLGRGVSSACDGSGDGWGCCVVVLW